MNYNKLYKNKLYNKTSSTSKIPNYLESSLSKLGDKNTQYNPRVNSTQFYFKNESDNYENSGYNYSPTSTPIETKSSNLSKYLNRSRSLLTKDENENSKYNLYDRLKYKLLYKSKKQNNLDETNNYKCQAPQFNTLIKNDETAIFSYLMPEYEGKQSSILSIPNSAIETSDKSLRLFEKSESQPVSRKGSENERKLNYVGLRSSLPTKFARDQSIFSALGSNEKLLEFKWYNSLNDDLKEFGNSNILNLWSCQSYVIDSGLLDKMDKRQIELQERWFEIFTSEISYYKSLKILDEIIMKNFEKTLNSQDFNMLFTKNLTEIIALSKDMILAFDLRIKENIIIENLFDIMLNIVGDKKFQKSYVYYAGENNSQKENYDKIIKNNKKFSDSMQKLNFSPILEGKDILSYFITPIQRLSRYKLLVDAIVNILPDDSPLLIQEGMYLSKLIKKILNKANKKAAESINYSECVKLLMLLKFQNNEINMADLVHGKRELLMHGDLLSVKTLAIDRKIIEMYNTINSKKARSQNDKSMSGTRKYHVILLSDLFFICDKEENQDGTFYYKVLIKTDRERVDSELSEWETLSNDQGDGPDNDKDDESFKLKSHLLIFTILNDKSRNKNPGILNKKFLFLCSRQEGESWTRFFDK
ncbi:unnamed protein product, partial [Brachionus calyciflorus]